MTTNESQLKIIIADDEALARNVVRKYLAPFPEVKIIAECENGLKTLNKINELKPDLVFLDIQMPDLDGLALLNELSQPPMVIFTTAYNQYALHAFEKNAVDYLLKPFNKERFELAFNKALRQKASPAFLEQKLVSLQNSLDHVLHPTKKYILRILIKEKNSYSFLDVNDVLWFEADSDYVKIHTKDKFYLKNTSLHALEEKLNPQTFIRIHRSTIVNISSIRQMNPYFNGEYHLVLSNGEKLKLSRSYRDKLKLIIDESI